MGYRLLLLVFAICLLTFASCSVSKNPISAIEDAERDERLVGVWIADEDDGKVSNKAHGDAYLHIGAEPDSPISLTRKEPEPALMRFVLVGHEQKLGRKVVEPFAGRFFVSKVGEQYFVNMLFDYGPKDMQDAKPGYRFMTYSVDDDRLEFWFAADELFVKAVKDGTLAGKIVKIGGRFKIEAAELTATSEELTAFLKTDAGKKAFARDGDDGKLTFRRLR